MQNYKKAVLLNSQMPLQPLFFIADSTKSLMDGTEVMTL